MQQMWRFDNTIHGVDKCGVIKMANMNKEKFSYIIYYAIFGFT
jgi:hypothetical protein